MRIRECVWLALLALTITVSGKVKSPEDYDEWAIEIAHDKDMTAIAKAIAKKYGLEFVRTINEKHMPEFFHVRAESGTLDVETTTRDLKNERKVLDVTYQQKHQVGQRSYVREVTKDAYYPSSSCQCHQNSANGDTAISGDVFRAMNSQTKGTSMSTYFNDYKWPCQWQLYNCGQTGEPNEYDLDVAPVWLKGITGKGMVVGIVDDGLDYTNEDLGPNFDRNASIDLVEYPDHDGPLPYSDKPHGTECAGVVGMAANNGFCGVGAVYEANIGGIRFIGEASTDVREAAALIYNANYIDVYSNSWGPSDTGKLYRKPPRLTWTSLERSCQHGRDGKGNIHLFASGNGGTNDDNCGADGFTCSIYTMGVAASSPNGLSVVYSEQCTCIMFTVPATDPHEKGEDIKMMIVPTLNNGCLNSFRGTSSATPLGSSLMTMALQANPNLTWRDAQYLVAHTALVVDPHNTNWQINGAGYHVHPYYGFGALNALHLVEAAERWTNVPEQQRCALSYPHPYKVIPSGGQITLIARADGCVGTDNQVLKLEHVQVFLSYKVKCRGDISIKLTSPCGTVSPLINTRRLDDLTTVIEWPYMTVFNWGEDTRGVWTLEITDNKGTVESCERSEDEISAGHMWQYELVLWGVREESRRSRAAPVCDKKNVYDYMERSDGRDRHFQTLIDQKSSIATTLYDEFLEDFSEYVQEKTSEDLQPRPPGPRKTRPYTVPYQQHTMAVWRSTFHNTKSKSKALASYAVKGISPHPNRMSARHFDVVRQTIAERLLKRVEDTDDDGNVVVRKDILKVAKALMNERGEKKSFCKSKKDAAIILRNLADIWDY